jgi:nicotinamide-nucleotide amidase
VATRSGAVGLTRTLHCAGRGESEVAELVERTIDLPPGVDLAYLAGGAVVRVRLTTVAATERRRRRGPRAARRRARAAPRPTVFGRDGDTLPAVVLRRLVAAGETVAVAESLTGGLLGAALTELPGSSAAFRGGLLVYATDTKAALAGVPAEVLAADGAVSSATAEALARGARERLGATWGVGVTGVAGPDEQEGQPVGTVHVAVAGPTGVRSLTRRFPGDRQRVRLLAVTARSTCCAGSCRRNTPERHGRCTADGRSALGGRPRCVRGGHRPDG